MSRKVKVQDELDFESQADTGKKVWGNIKGRPSFDQVVLYDDFLGDLLADEWGSAHGNGGNAAAVVVGANGIANVAVNATDDDCSQMYGELNWYARQELVFEARVKLSRITLIGAFIGLSDEKFDTNDQIKCEINGTTIVDRGTNPDLIGFCFDTDATNDYWYAVNSKAGTQAGTSLAVAPVAATYEVFRIELDASGNATFYRNGSVVHSKASAITATAPLTPYFGLINRAGAAGTLHIDYCKCWQKRGETSSIVV